MTQPVSLKLSRAVHLVNRFAPEIPVKFRDAGSVDVGAFLVGPSEDAKGACWAVWERAARADGNDLLLKSYGSPDTAVFYAASEALWHLLNEAMGGDSS